MVMLQLKLLGGFESRLDAGPPLLTSARKAQALLAYLAMSRGRPRARSHLATLLWGSHGEEQARNSLRQTLFVLRRALPGFPGLVASAGQVSLQAGTYRADALDLERMAENGPVTDVAIEPFIGELLEGFEVREPDYQEWLEVERRRCRDLVQTVLRAQLTAFDEPGSVTRAIETAQRLLALDPLQEDIHRSLIQLYVSQGRHGDAARQRELCREALQRDLGLTLSAETEQASTLAAGAPQRFDFDRRRAPGTTRGHPPVVTVLPFASNGDDRRLDGLAAGLAEDIAANLATFRLFRVANALTGRPRASDADALLRAGHTVDGSVRRIANNVHITVRLLDTAGGHILWSKRFDHRLSDVLELGEDVALAICGTIAPILEILDLHALSDDEQPMSAWCHYRRGMRLVNRLTQADNAAARDAFERAIDRDPTHVRAFAGLAQAHAMDHTYAFVSDRAVARARCTEAALLAVELDPFEVSARCALAHPLRHERNFDRAIMELERAAALNPSSGQVQIDLGHTLDVVGRPSEGLELMTRGKALVRQYTGCLGKFARAALNTRDYDAAIELAHEAIQHQPTYPQSYLHLASALGHLGRRREARAALRACEDASPGFANVYNPCYAKQSDEDHYFEGLAAG